jgi:hypothetical protein
MTARDMRGDIRHPLFDAIRTGHGHVIASGCHAAVATSDAEDYEASGSVSVAVARYVGRNSTVTISWQ